MHTSPWLSETLISFHLEVQGGGFGGRGWGAPAEELALDRVAPMGHEAMWGCSGVIRRVEPHAGDGSDTLQTFQCKK
eukprot:398239-Pelagomonas_calceolata.AAC.1